MQITTMNANRSYAKTCVIPFLTRFISEDLILLVPALFEAVQL